MTDAIRDMRACKFCGVKYSASYCPGCGAFPLPQPQPGGAPAAHKHHARTSPRGQVQQVYFIPTDATPDATPAEADDD